MCFRTATDAFRYQRDLDRGDPERPENYIPVPGVTPHAFLLSLPIDHPEMTEEMGGQPNAQRCRQLVGVLSIGSASPASSLLEYCRLTITDEVFDRLRDLRDACQRKLDAISYALLETAGVWGQRATTLKTEAVTVGAGIVHQPGPAWVSPVRTNRFRHKVAAFDFDGTLLRGDKFVFSWELVWRELGFGQGIQNELKRKYRQQAQAQRIEAYRHWCESAVEKYKNRSLTRDQLRAMSQPLSLTKNCRDAIKDLRAEGVVTAIISGGITAILEDTFADYRDYFDFVFMNELLFDSSGMISGVRATAYDFEGKADALALVCNRAGATREETVFIGDRFNDESAMIQAKTAIAYLPTDDVAKGVSHVTIHVDDLREIVPHILVE
jgi:HAD superfamily phosphoserine phosphatase-like hydrolase